MLWYVPAPRGSVSAGRLSVYAGWILGPGDQRSGSQEPGRREAGPPGSGAEARAAQATSPPSFRSDSFRAAVAESFSLPAISETAAPVNSPSMRTVVASPSGISV